MAHMLKVGSDFINLDQVTRIEACGDVAVVFFAVAAGGEAGSGTLVDSLVVHNPVGRDLLRWLAENSRDVSASDVLVELPF